MKKIIALLSCLAMLGTCAMSVFPVQAAHTLENTYVDKWSDDELDDFLAWNSDNYYQEDDGIFYCTESYCDGIWDEYVPRPGTFDRTTLLLALLKKYPEGRFAVWITNIWDDVLATEMERLRQNGIEFDSAGNLVLTAEQLENFPASESLGYFIALAQKPLQTGDVNKDGTVSLSDVVALNKYLMIGYDIGSDALRVADVDKNGIVDEIDSLNILKSIIGLVDLNELG